MYIYIIYIYIYVYTCIYIIYIYIYIWFWVIWFWVRYGTYKWERDSLGLLRLKWFGCKEHGSWKPVFFSSKYYVGVSGLSFATTADSGKAGNFVPHKFRDSTAPEIQARIDGSENPTGLEPCLLLSPQSHDISGSHQTPRVGDTSEQPDRVNRCFAVKELAVERHHTTGSNKKGCRMLLTLWPMQTYNTRNFGWKAVVS